jgi:hypothetical protein
MPWNEDWLMAERCAGPTMHGVRHASLSVHASKRRTNSLRADDETTTSRRRRRRQRCGSDWLRRWPTSRPVIDWWPCCSPPSFSAARLRCGAGPCRHEALHGSRASRACVSLFLFPLDCAGLPW